MPPRTRGSKRNEPPSPAPEKASKRARNSSKPSKQDVIIIEDSDEEMGTPDDNDDIEAILAQIKSHEESERLAKQLQQEYERDEPIASGSHTNAIAIDDPLIREADGPSSDVEIVSDSRAPFVSPKALKKTRHISEQPSNVSEVTRATLSTRDNFKSFASPASSRPDQGLKPFRDLFKGIRECTKCGKEVNSPRGCVMFSDSLLPPSMTFLLHAPCSSCHTNHCRGCFKPIECRYTCKGPTKNPECRILDCCAEQRAIAIFETLGGFDRTYLLELSASKSRTMANAKNALKTGTVGPGGTGYATGSSGGRPLAQYSQASKKAEAEKSTASHWEDTVIRAMKVLIELLPAPYSDNPQVYDLLPHASIGHLISISQLPSVLADLLRNDSVTDWISRKETYNTMLSLLRRMADCELTIQCLIGQRWETSTTCGIEEWMRGNGKVVWTKSSSGELEIAAPLYTYFKKLTKQSEAFQAGALQMLGEGDGEGDVEDTMIQGTSLCGDILAARDELERAIAMLGLPSTTSPTTDRENRSLHEAVPSRQTRSSKKGKGRAVAIDIDQAYTEACERLAFKHVSLAEGAGSGYLRFNYAKQLTQTQNSTRLPKDRLHLLKELAVTATSLPPGVWVRVDEVRNDAIKIMIAGPEGTPYAGGLFEFDCFIPLQYPNVPPLMHLRTTGGGFVRFNPNLYNCGKVCLSLLGTWAGSPEEQWLPGKSTLLQVLVSIQSMILVDAPYYNEPGHGQANVNSPLSITYNKNISAQTVRWAIVDWLKDEHRNGIWRDVIASHFSIRKDKIRQGIVEWSKTIPQIRAYTGSQAYPALQTHVAIPSSATPKLPSSQSTGLDLLTAFDKGVQLVESWEVGQDAI